MSLDNLEDFHIVAQITGLEEVEKEANHQKDDNTIPQHGMFSEFCKELIQIQMMLKNDVREKKGMQAKVFAVSEKDLDKCWPKGNYFELEFELPDNGPKTTVFFVDTSNKFEMEEVDDLIEGLDWKEKLDSIKEIT
jgi:hypothetical protein